MRLPFRFVFGLASVLRQVEGPPCFLCGDGRAVTTSPPVVGAILHRSRGVASACQDSNSTGQYTIVPQMADGGKVILIGSAPRAVLQPVCASKATVVGLARSFTMSHDFGHAVAARQ